MTLAELQKRITPLPYAIKRGDPQKENEVACVRGVTIFGAYKSVSAIDDARYLNHCANIMPELVIELKKAQKRICELTGCSKMLGAHTSGCSALREVITCAENVTEETK